MELHHSLPFSSLDFVWFSLGTVLLFFIAKSIFKNSLFYKIVLTISNVLFISLLYPKPWEIFALVLILYLIVISLKKYYKGENIGIPMLILSIPIILMKTANVISFEENSAFFKAKTMVQIAGLSYMVFKIIGLYVDTRRSKENLNVINFFNFAVFFPTLLIGPIDRYERFCQDMSNGFSNLNADKIEKSFTNLAKGLLFKFIIAELIARIVLNHISFENTFVNHFVQMYAYLFYLFFDFAGYSLLAIGLGGLMGINVPINFDKPFLALNPKEFWKKWHKSLGDWLNDYFFKPIFKYLTSKKYFKSIQRQNIALFLTFSLMGFWNGFELHFIASGMLFGVYSVIHNYYIYRCKKSKKDVFFGSLSPAFVRIISIFLMLNSVAFSIYIFSGKLI